MLRPLGLALLVVCLVVGTRLRAVQAQGEPTSARASVQALESRLLQADEASRPALLGELRAAYAAAEAEAEKAGDAPGAEVYRTNLAILEERLGPEQTGTPSEVKNEPIASPPPALPDPEQVLPPVQAAEGESNAELPVQPEAEEQPAVADDSESLKRQGDALYRAAKYSEAGKIYGRLVALNQLPENRRNAWAYCRRFEVVRRINAQPRSDGEWSAIAAEIAAIRQLSPTVWWFDVYLQDLVRERSGKVAKAAPRSDAVVLRGAQPEERPLSLPRSLPRLSVRPASAPKPPAPAPTAPAPAVETPKPVEMPPPAVSELPSSASTQPVENPAMGDAIPFQSPDLSRWQVVSTTNFRIYHADVELARRVARIAEATREEQIRRWTGQPPRGNWYPVCEVYLYPNAKIFSQRTEQPEDSPGFSTSGLMAGRVTARRINLRADHDKLETAILPHEVTHIVLAEIFADRQIPRWADEGMAVLAEPTDEQKVRARDLSKPLNGGRIFAVEQLLVMDYPDGQYWPLYYAQSISLTRFLVETSTPVRFVQFVKDAQHHGYDAALRRHYQIEGLADLQTKWEAFARSTVGVQTAANEVGEATERQ